MHRVCAGRELPQDNSRPANRPNATQGYAAQEVRVIHKCDYAYAVRRPARDLVESATALFIRGPSAK